MSLHGWQKPSRKADQFTLANGDSKHAVLFNVAVNCDNIKNFSLCAKLQLAGFVHLVTFIYAYIHNYVRVCMYVCMYVVCTCIYIYIYIYIYI